MIRSEIYYRIKIHLFIDEGYDYANLISTVFSLKNSLNQFKIKLQSKEIEVYF